MPTARRRGLAPDWRGAGLDHAQRGRHATQPALPIEWISPSICCGPSYQRVRSPFDGTLPLVSNQDQSRDHCADALFAARFGTRRRRGFWCRPSRGTSTWCRRAAAETAACPARTASAPTAGAASNPYGSNKAVRRFGQALGQEFDRFRFQATEAGRRGRASPSMRPPDPAPNYESAARTLLMMRACVASSR